jgi:hypothetical protein
VRKRSVDANERRAKAGGQPNYSSVIWHYHVPCLSLVRTGAGGRWPDATRHGLQIKCAAPINASEQPGSYRLGYDAKTFDEIAKIFTQVIGQPFSYEPRPPKEFLEKVLSAGGEPAYMDCAYDSYRRLSGEGIPGSDETFDNFTPITGRQPNTLADFARKHATRFKY